MGAVSLMAGCLVPEKFEASLQFKPDGSYDYEYAGTVVNVDGGNFSKDGRPSQRNPKDQERMADELQKVPGVTRASHVGNGRYEIRVVEQLQPGRRSKTVPVAVVKKDADGSYLVTGPDLKKSDIAMYRELGIKIEGRIKVLLPSNAKVLMHNAEAAPGWLSKAYTWKVGSFDEKPTIRFTLSN